MIAIPQIAWGRLLLKTLPYGIAVLTAFAVVWGIYSIGSKNGAARVQANWNIEKLANEKALTKLRNEMAARELTHRQETQRISDDLAEANQKHAATVAAIDAQFSQRLHNSEQRATYYQRMSDSGPAQCSNLAGHAAKLDRSLEEGRRLVQEFGATLRQRDAQLTALGQQILTDRALIGDKDGQSSASTE